MPRNAPQYRNSTRPKEPQPMGYCPICKKDVSAVVVEGKLVCANPEAATDKHFLYQRVSVFRSTAEREDFLSAIQRERPTRRWNVLDD